MLFRLFAFMLFLMPVTLWASTLTLLEIPLNDGGNFSYIIDATEKCSFRDVTAIRMPEMEKPQEDTTVLEKLELIQQKLNLVIDKSDIGNDRITFSLKGAQNAFFEFYFSKEEDECQLIKILHLGNRQFVIKSIEIHYTTALKLPVVEKIIVKNNEGFAQELYPWALRGQTALYEFNIGPALNVHTNIRVRDQNTLQRSNPVIEPIPAFLFRYGTVFLNKDGIGSLLYNTGDLSILGMGILEGEPYKGPGLRDRKKGAYIGSIVKYNFAEFTYYKDFFTAKGYNLKLNLAPEFYPRLSWKIVPQVFMQYWDNQYMDYYFGVNNAEIDSGMKLYKGKHTINYGTMFEVTHYKERWTFLTTAGVKFYGPEVYDSPTVRKKSEIRFITSVLYKLF